MLRRLQLLARLLDGDEAGLIDFRERLELARIERPFHAKRVALVNMAVRRIALAGPGINDFAALLLDGSKLHKRSGRLEPHFFVKLADRRFRQLLTLVGFTL